MSLLWLPCCLPLLTRQKPRWANLSFMILLPLPCVMESIIPLERVKVESGRRMAGPGRVVLFVPEEERLLMC